MQQAETLCAALSDETRVCRALADALRREQRAVVELRADAVLASLTERTELGAALADAAARRRAAAGALASTLGAGKAPANAILPLLPVPARGRVRAGMRDVRRALLEARGLERQNALLARASLASVDELLAMLRAHVPGARYGADARVEAPLPERVDRRA